MMQMAYTVRTDDDDDNDNNLYSVDISTLQQHAHHAYKKLQLIFMCTRATPMTVTHTHHHSHTYDVKYLIFRCTATTPTPTLKTKKTEQALHKNLAMR